MAQLHHLPCKIDHDGPARVSTFFLPTPKPDGGERHHGGWALRRE
jgi:hypothetical protein